MKIYTLVVACVFTLPCCGSWSGVFLTDKQLLYNMNKSITALNQALARGQAVTIYNNGKGIATHLSMKQELHGASMPLSGAPHGDEPEQPTGWFSWLKKAFWGTPSKHGAPSGMGGYLATHKVEVAGKAAFVWYGYVNLTLYTLKSKLQKEDLWSQWRSDIALSELLALPRHEVIQSLVADLYKRYGHQQATIPVHEFAEALRDEQDALRRYQSLARSIMQVDAVKCRLCGLCGDYMPKFLGVSTGIVMNFVAGKLKITSLFYIDKELLAEIPERLSKIAYLRNIISEWMLEKTDSLKEL